MTRGYDMPDHAPDKLFVSPYLTRRLRSLDEVLAERAARTAASESDDDECADDHGTDDRRDIDAPATELRLV